jgi:antitoxin component YwqK of YwqJK toxin-antitoxin module
VVYRRDGNVRVGQWKNGIMNGYGALLDANGRILEQGQYVNDRLATPMKGN